jgi:Asp-tRNA(Asn)/Glu-tRNA(Gln) amidotransferase C subunit
LVRYGPKQLITEENKNEKSIHIHLRNLRLEFSEDEFNEFAEHIKRSTNAFKKQEGVNADDGRDGNYNNYFILDNKETKDTPSFRKDLLQVELNEPNIIHIHFRNLSMILSPEEFKEFADTLDKAFKKFEKVSKNE